MKSLRNEGNWKRREPALYQEMFEKQKKITDQYEGMVARLEAKEKRSEVRNTVQSILATILGIFLGRAF